MLRNLGMLAVVCALLTGLSAAADDDDFVMGNYQGAVSGPGWEGKTIRAQVAAMSVIRYRAVFYVGAGAEEQRVEIKGTKESGPDIFKAEDKVKARKEVVIAFEGEADLGSALGGACAIRGKITNETFIGTLKNKQGEGRFELKRVFLEPPTLGQKAPEGAVVLLDGTSMDQWNAQPYWQIQGDGSMQTVGSSLATKNEYGDGLYHIEFVCPFMPSESGQARGNSGVYVFGRYEVQVLDSFADLPADNLCGGIYKEAKPIVCASLPPLQWQTYDITFTAPKFDASGKKTQDAVITVVHNGVTIHDQVKLSNVTPGGVSDKEAPQGILMVQDHGNDVRFRNIWYQPAN
jgi:hypothetical protein